jgi:hypothetical protein
LARKWNDGIFVTLVFNPPKRRNMRVGIATDHGDFDLKEELVKQLQGAERIAREELAWSRVGLRISDVTTALKLENNSEQTSDGDTRDQRRTKFSFGSDFFS